MLIPDAFCYALLTITITATCVGGEQTNQEGENIIEKRGKREAALIIDSYPSSTYKAKPNIIHQRYSNTKYRKSKQKYGPVIPKYRPTKPKYGPPKPIYGPPKPKYGPPKPPSYKNRKPVKKHKRKPIRASKYNNKRITMSKYRPIKKPYGPPKPKRPQQEPYYAPEPVPFGEPAGFGEPPKDHVKEYVQPPQQNYAEPPVDSYGVPLKATNFPPSIEPFNNDNFDNFDQQYQSYQSYQQDLNVDNINSHTKNHPIYATPDAEFDEEHQSKYEDSNLDSYSNVYKNIFLDTNTDKSKLRYHFPHNIHKNRPWKSRVKPGADSEHIVVGGQYAEPPGRLVRQSHPSGLIYGDDSGPPNTYADSEVAASATISPYVNYKHSNMAFSPQNLNDAFSITK